MMIAELPATGGYFSPVKVGIFAVFCLAWSATAAWVDQDTIRAKVSKQPWNAIVFGGGAMGIALWILLPQFYLGLLAFLVFYGGTSVWYCLMRNGKVAPGQQVLTPAHLKRLFGKQAKTEDAAQSGDKVRIKGADGKAAKWPTDPEHRESYRALQEFLFDAIWRRASVVDITIAAQQAKIVYRVDGVNREREPIERPLADALLEHLKRISGMDPTEQRKPQSGKIIGAVGPGGKQDKVVEIQVRTSGSTAGQRVVMSLFSDESKFRATDIGLNKNQLPALQAAIEKPRGVVVVAGPKESGVTSTLYALVRSHDAFMKNIHTLETAKVMDIDNVTQHVFDSKGGAIPFARQLQSIIRMEPDVLMVSECPDHDTAELIAAGGKQNRKIYVGLAASDTLSAVRKYMQLVGETESAAAGLEAVLAQRLVRVLCPSCRKAYKPDPTLLKRMNLPADDTRVFYRPPNPDELEVDKKGNPIICQVCQGSGYLGRTGIFEVLIVDPEIRSMLSQGAPLMNVKAHARRNKMQYLQECGLLKVFDGMTSINEVLRVTRDDAAGPAGPPKPAPKAPA
jgi:type II secretory ATPase GspE/PulE/Tfp pilus assembly ATPase PilB-like protein